MLLIDYPSGLIALSIFLLIAVIALFSTVSNIQNDKENKHLHIENEMLKDKLESVKDYSLMLQLQKERKEYRQSFTDNLKNLNVGDKK